MSKLIIIIGLFLSSISFAQDSSARTGIDTGSGTSRLGIDTGNGVSRRVFVLSSDNRMEAVAAQRSSRNRLGLNSSKTDQLLNSFALDLNNVEEVILKDGTVYRIEDIKKILKPKKSK